MGGSEPSSVRRRFARARRFRRSRRGVVSVIGTLLALLVFFALFGIFLTQYLPLWMVDNEEQFTAQAESSFALLKSNIDSQYVLGGPPAVGTPFTISSQGVPLLAQPTEATLEFLPTSCPGGFYAKGVTGATASNYGQPVNSSYCVFANMTMTAGPGSSGYFTQRIASGVVEMLLPNRYYAEQSFYMEDDAVIQTQPGGFEVMDLAPPLNFTHTAGNTSITGSLLQMVGNSSIVLGQGSEIVYSHFRYASTVTSFGTFVKANSSYLPFKFTFEIGTQNPCAWWGFLSNLTKQSGLSAANITLTPSTPYPLATCLALGGVTQDLKVVVSNVNYVSYYNAGVQIVLGVGGT